MFCASFVVIRSASGDRGLLTKMKTLAQMTDFAQLIDVGLVIDGCSMVYLVEHCVVEAAVPQNWHGCPSKPTSQPSSSKSPVKQKKLKQLLKNPHGYQDCVPI